MRIAAFSGHRRLVGNPVILCDSSFVVKSLIPGDEAAELRAAWQGQAQLVYNMLVYAEVANYITPIFFQNKIEDDFNPSVDISDRARWLRRRKQSNTRQGIKEFARMQRWEVFEKIFGSKGEHLKAEVERYFSGMSHRNFRGEGKATGDALFQVIAHGALGATDALLINFANNDPGIHGFVTCDRDFLHLENFSSIRKDLVIYLPDSLIEGQKRRAA